MTRKPIRRATVRQLMGACKSLMQCLNGWVEIADSQDVRMYDRVALRLGVKALAKAESELSR